MPRPRDASGSLEPAILIPTLIAIWLARGERAAAREAAARERRLSAGAAVLRSLAPLISLDVTAEPIQHRLGQLRGDIAVYRAWIEGDDISGDWLALKHTEGMHVWSRAMEDLEEAGGAGPDNVEYVAELLDRPRRWAHGTIETFSAWLAGTASDEQLRQEGAQLLFNSAEEKA